MPLYPEIVFFFTDKITLSKEKSFHKPKALFIPPYTEAKSSFTKLSSPIEAVPLPPLHKRKTLFPSQISFAPRARPFLFRCSPFQGAKPVVK